MNQSVFLFIILILIGLLIAGWFTINNEVNIAVTDFQECSEAGNPVMESYPRQCRAGGQTFVEDIGNELEKSDLIRISTPRPNQEITSPLTIEGEARGFWFFEGDFPIKLLDESGGVIVQHYATAVDEWMTEDFVSFKAIIEFDSAPQKGILTLEKDNPSGLPENDDELIVPVRIRNEQPELTGQNVIIKNTGTATMEGHTPRGFEGQGVGLFAGDNLNFSFPDGDGVQMFLSFDISELTGVEIISAVLRSKHSHTTGTPYADLGILKARDVRYDKFSSALWNHEAGSFECDFATSLDGPFECDVTETVIESRTGDHQYVQFRLAFEKTGDNDGEQDLASFFITDSNTNESGIFEIILTTLQMK